ncbi:MAG: tRNA (adenosine(37)-N6)-threonylcarbamoyltransferase complex ATPase subunit type 1 TsaE [Clostridiales bacterium]|nr:tRNA (adenosine(37)-N6)-threonylcarbamoyltransferase complex ATPase subunit type 1 TsaE [Clostridiales bacterium]
MICRSNSAEETRQFAYQLGKKAKSGDIFCLDGDLGVGKTVFTQGFASGLGVSDPYITSPTFTIINEYEGRLKLFHFDVYRITSIEEMDDTGYEEYFFSDGVCLVEWAELIKEIIPEKAVWIKISKDLSQGENFRLIDVGGDKK